MWINKLKSFLLNTIYPLKCIGCQKSEVLICPKCFQKLISLANQPIRQETSYLEKIIIALNYKEHIVKKIIKSFKYPPYIESLKKILSSFLIIAIKKFPDDISYLRKNNFVLASIPLSKLKLAKRGFNQSDLIATELSQKLSLKYQPELLKKIKDTESQTSLNAQERKINIKNIFRFSGNKCPSNIILVDDIYTTGATLEAASHVLRQAGAKKIWAFILAQG